MTVTTSTNKKTYTGDASTTAFAYNFKILATTDLKVYTRLIASPYTETLQTETTHYSVSGAGDAGGGTVTMVSAPAATLQLIIVRAVPQTQLTDYTANDAFPAETHEEALDRLAMIVQDQQETLDRTLKVSKTVTDLTTPEFKEPAAARAGKFLSFDGDGDELTVTDGPLADAVITSPADAHILLYDNGDTRWENKAVSGDIAITAAGVASIASGVIVNADVSGSAAIVDTKLATIATADKVSGAAIQVDGATDGTGITIADADKLLVDDAGTTKYVNASQLNSYISAAVAADDIGTGDAAASFATSSGAVVVDSQASTTTVDGHTGVTVQSSSSGDILLDSAADVVLDAAGNDVIFKASGTAIGTLTNSSSDLVIAASVEDKDILLKGDDGGSAITALSLDMSDAGKATFSGGVALGDDQKLSFGAAPDLTIEYDEDGTDTTRIVAANGLSLAPHGTSSGNTTELRFMELAAGGNNYVGFKAADAVTDSVYTLPAAYPASNKLLQSTDAGVLTWEAAGVSNQNIIHNGSHTVDQRSGEARDALGASDFYVSDRWQVEGGGSPSARWDASIETTGGPVGADRWLKLLNDTADASPGSTEYQAVKQGIESFNCTPLVDATNGKVAAFTVSGKVIAHSSSSFPLKLPLVVSTQTGSTRQYVKDIIITNDATWQSFSVTVPADATASFTQDSAKGLVVGFGLYGGSGRQSTDGSWVTFGSDWVTSASHNWAGAANNYIGFTNIKCEPGSVATAYIDPSLQSQLADCQRYFWRRTRVSGTNHFLGMVYLKTATVAENVVSFPVSMRAAATIAFSAVDDFAINHNNSAVTTTNMTATTPGTDNVLISCTVASGFTVGQSGYFYLRTNGDYIQASAEI